LSPPATIGVVVAIIVNFVTRRPSRCRHRRRRRRSSSSLPPFAIVFIVVSRRAVTRRTIECLCWAAAADARDDAMTTTMVVL